MLDFSVSKKRLTSSDDGTKSANKEKGEGGEEVRQREGVFRVVTTKT